MFDEFRRSVPAARRFREINENEMSPCRRTLFLALLTCARTEHLPLQGDDIEEHVSVRRTPNDFVNEVTVGDYSCGTVRAYRPKNKGLDIGKKHAFHTAVSCVFAEWTANRLYDALKLQPLFDRYKHEDVGLYDRLFAPYFHETIVAFEGAFDARVERMSRVLHNVWDTNADVLYYGDTTVLKTLTALRIRLRAIMLSLKTVDELADATRIVARAVRLLLTDMTALQSFLSVNCRDAPPPGAAADGPSYFYGYRTKTKSRAAAEDVDAFLSDVGNRVQLVSASSTDQPGCSTSQTMWENFVSSDDGLQLSAGIVAAEVRIADRRSVAIGELLRRVRLSYDADATAWFRRSVLYAIVKILFRQVIDVLEDPGFEAADAIFQTIGRLHDDLLSRSAGLPDVLVNGVTALNDAASLQNAKTRLTAIKNHYDSIDETVCVENPRSKDKAVSLEERVDDLVKTLTKLLASVDDFECVQISIDYLHGEHERYYLPFAGNKSELIAENVQRSDEPCEFVVNVYSYLFRVIGSVVSCTDRKPSGVVSAQNCTSEFRESLLRVRNYFAVIVKWERNDIALLKTAYTVATLLENTKVLQVPSDHRNVPNALRVLEVVMFELNAVGITFCTSQNFNFLLSNKINVLRSGDLDAVETSIGEFLYRVDDAVTVDHVNDHEAHYDLFKTLNLKYFHDTYVKKSRCFKLYADKIKFYWKGSPRTAEEIYDDLAAFAINPRDLYAYSDVYFKFYIAVLHYEIKQIFDVHEDEKRMRTGVIKLFGAFLDITYENFPDGLAILISDFRSLNADLLDQNITTNIQLGKRIRQIDERFKKYNIVFRTKIVRCKKKFRNLLSLPIIPKEKLKIFATINSEISETVNFINKNHFLKYGR